MVATLIGATLFSKLTFVPFEIREVVNGFVEKFFSNSVVKNITVESVGAALLTIFATFVIGGVVKFVVSKIKFKKHRTETLHQLVGKFLVYGIYILGVKYVRSSAVCETSTDLIFPEETVFS